jgi:hypothetical protein
MRFRALVAGLTTVVLGALVASSVGAGAASDPSTTATTGPVHTASSIISCATNPVTNPILLGSGQAGGKACTVTGGTDYAANEQVVVAGLHFTPNPLTLDGSSNGSGTVFSLCGDTLGEQPVTFTGQTSGHVGTINLTVSANPDPAVCATAVTQAPTGVVAGPRFTG